MTDRLELKYEGTEDYRWPIRPSYDQIVSTFGNPTAWAHHDDYQGDSIYLIEKDGRLGILTFGWGSCSGCDALEACESQEELDRLQDDLERGIKWFEDHYEVEEYLAGGGLKDSFLRFDLVTRFFNEVNTYLKGSY